MAYRAAGVGAAGEGFPIAAFPVLTYKQPAVLPVYFQHQFTALRAFCAGSDYHGGRCRSASLICWISRLV